MNAGIHTRAVRGVRPHSLFYRDLGLLPTTDTSSVGGVDGGTPSQVTAALWRANDAGGSDPPPPPFYTLEDRIERSPEANTNLSFHLTPQFADRNASSGGSRTVLLSPNGGGGGSLHGGEKHDLQGLSTSGQEPPLSEANSWWSPRRETRSGGGVEAVDRDGTTTPMSGVIQQQQSGGGLLTLSLPGEIVRPEGFGGSAKDDSAEGEGWVTVFGFSVDETNSVMREFEKCGRIINHVSGPGGANWVHLQYLNHYDAQKALMKNGIQLNSALIVGVKRLDPLQSQGLTEKAKGGGRFSFTTLPPRNPNSKPSARPNYQQTAAADSAPPPALRSSSVIASPAKSTFSRLVDLVFGM